jgi:hypothetical protein
MVHENFLLYGLWQEKARIQEERQEMQKTLLAALALSPGSKAITEVDEHQRLVVQEHWNDTEVWYNVSLIDMKEGDVTHRTTVGGSRCSAILDLQLRSRCRH